MWLVSRSDFSTALPLIILYVESITAQKQYHACFLDLFAGFVQLWNNRNEK